MKKLLGFMLCVSLFAGITACDSNEKTKLDNNSLMMGAALMGQSIGNDWNIPEIVNLAGQTYEYVSYNYIMRADVVTNGTTTTTTYSYIPYTVKTSTITFNADYTFDATLTYVYHANYSNSYQNSAGTTYSMPIQGRTGYAGQPVMAPGAGSMSRVTVGGIWKKYLKYDDTNDEARWEYEIKVFTSRTETFVGTPIDSSTYASALTNTYIANATIEDADQWWQKIFANGYADQSSSSDGTEARFTLVGGMLLLGFDSGVFYTRQAN